MLTFLAKRAREGFAGAAAKGLYALELELQEVLKQFTARILPSTKDNVRAAVGDFVRLNPPAGTVPRVLLPDVVNSGDGEVHIALEAAGSFQLLAADSKVNGVTGPTFSDVGLYRAKSDGAKSWWVQGSRGPQGPQGAAGANGATGATGATGPQGAGFSDGDKGDITVGGGGTTFTVDNGAITHAKEANMAAQSYVGNPTGGSAVPQDIAVSAESVVGRTSGNLGQITSAVQTALIRAAGSLFFASAAAGQHLRRSLAGGDLGFSALEIGLMAGGAGSRVNSTTNISCGSFNAPANSLVVGSTFRFFCHYVFAHTAAPPTLTFEILINGVVAETKILTFVATATTQGGIMWGILRVVATGAGGLTNVHMGGITDGGTAAASQFGPTTATGTDAIDTTAARTLELRVRMTTAVASNTLTVMAGGCERLS